MNWFDIAGVPPILCNSESLLLLNPELPFDNVPPLDCDGDRKMFADGVFCKLTATMGVPEDKFSSLGDSMDIKGDLGCVELLFDLNRSTEGKTFLTLVMLSVFVSPMTWLSVTCGCDIVAVLDLLVLFPSMEDSINVCGGCGGGNLESLLSVSSSLDSPLNLSPK